MTTFFILVSGLSVVFFLVFFWQCGKPRRPARNHDHAVSRPQMGSTYYSAGPHNLAHLERQMADFLRSHQRRALVLLLALAFIPMALRAQDAQPRAEQVHQLPEKMQLLSIAVAGLGNVRWKA